MIKVSKGEVSFKTYTRKMQRIINAITYKGLAIEMGTGAISDIPMENMMAAQEKAVELLFDKITIKGKDHEYKDLEDLETKELFTLNDWAIIEAAAINIVKNANELKKKLVK